MPGFRQRRADRFDDSPFLNLRVLNPAFLNRLFLGQIRWLDEVRAQFK